MMLRAVLISLLLPVPAAAQTLLETAAANMQLAMQICLQNYGTPDQMVPAFKQAGFSEAIEDFGDGEVIHWMSDPSNTTLVNVQPRPGQSFCAVSTELFGVTAALPYTRQVLGNIFSGEVFFESPEAQVIQPGDPQAANQPCTGYHFFAPQRLVWIQLGNAGQDPVCIEDGSVQIMMQM